MLSFTMLNSWGSSLLSRQKKRDREQNTPSYTYIFLFDYVRIRPIKDLKKEKCTKSIMYLRDSS